MRKETLAKIESAEGIARRGLVLSLLTQLKQVCNHPAQFLHEPGPLERRSGKLAALDELLDVILAEGESVLIFSQYVEMCRLIEAHLAARQVKTLFLHGGIGVRKREQLVAQFQAGEAQVFLLSLKAGGVGLTLTRATHVVHYDRWWNPAVEDQATDRAYRIGQDRPVQVHRLVTENTLEDRISTVIAAKRDLADAVVGSGEAWLSELSDAELTELVELSTTPVQVRVGERRTTLLRRPHVTGWWRILAAVEVSWMSERMPWQGWRRTGEDAGLPAAKGPGQPTAVRGDVVGPGVAGGAGAPGSAGSRIGCRADARTHVAGVCWS